MQRLRIIASIFMGLVVIIGVIFAGFQAFTPEKIREEIWCQLGRRSVCAPTPFALSTPAPVLYQEDFSTGQANGWIKDWGSTFQVVDDIAGKKVWRARGTGEYYLPSGFLWTNYAVSLKFRVVDWSIGDTNFHVAVRRQPDRGCSRYIIYLSRDRMEMHVGESNCTDRKISGKSQVSVSSGWIGTWHTLRIEALGSSISWQLDNGTTYKETDSTYPIGTISIYTNSIGEILFDDILVRSRSN
jgi:pectate lyase